MGLDADDYEVIVVDNGSSEPIDAELIEAFSGRLRVERLDPAPPSPARAANLGLGLAAVISSDWSSMAHASRHRACSTGLGVPPGSPSGQW